MAGENEVEYPTETMTTLANTRQTKWDTDATEGVKKIRDALADKSSFGDLPVLASYGSVFEEVRTIYLETMRGAKADLEAVAQGIRTSAQQMKGRDDQAGAAFVELWQRWENGPLESTRNHEQASSTESAQTAAETADAAETSTPGEPGQPGSDGGEIPTGENPDTEAEGQMPTSDTPPASGDDDTSTYDATAGQPQSPYAR
ncbi:hypothetical protein LL946_14350 [Knoellia locipacati]|uniref:hypothetical protein n=1 Tax=Knoellia locipacati TaxID=882824 RepID=UPI00384F1530